jgi:hypothetical protein
MLIGKALIKRSDLHEKSIYTFHTKRKGTYPYFNHRNFLHLGFSFFPDPRSSPKRDRIDSFLFHHPFSFFENYPEKRPRRFRLADRELEKGFAFLSSFSSGFFRNFHFSFL